MINLKKRLKKPKREQHPKSSVSERSKQLLLECSKQIKRRFPDLFSEFLSLDVIRNRKDYSLEEILMGGLSMFLFKQGSRNSINNKRREKSFSSTYAHYFGLRLPHQDSICRVLSSMPPAKLDQVKMDWLFSKKRLVV